MSGSNQLCDLIRSIRPAKWNTAEWVHDALPRCVLTDTGAFGNLVHHSYGSICFCVSGRNRVHANALRSDLLREAFTVVSQRCLGRCVCKSGIVKWQRSLNRRDMNNYTEALLDHRWKQRAVQSNSSEQVCVERVLPIVIGQR